MLKFLLKVIAILVLSLLIGLIIARPSKAEAPIKDYIADDYESSDITIKDNALQPPRQFIPNPESHPAPQKVRTRPTGGWCSCVLAVKAWTGFSKSIGFARNWPINSNIPQVGSVVITSESRAGHVALVTGVTETTITVKEGNFVKCKESTRTILRSASFIRGYYNFY